MKVIGREWVVYGFAPDMRPVAEVEPGEEVVFETRDCFSDQIQRPEDLGGAVNWDRVNPATGPLYIRGAGPGDALAVEVLDIEVADRGLMVAIPGLGAMGHMIKETEVKFIPIADGVAWFNETVGLPVRPMIGVIGVAPAEGCVPCGTPGPHGGNLDTRVIAPGARVSFLSWLHTPIMTQTSSVVNRLNGVVLEGVDRNRCGSRGQRSRHVYDVEGSWSHFSP